jgi:ribosomal protein S18 acetylase RimI-like enzyme
MHVTSLGFLTDVALRKLAGSTVEDCGDHIVVRTPSNPSFYWGNFLLLDHVPDADQAATWLARFEAALPEATHWAFGFDVPRGTVGDASGFAAHGLEVEALSVLTASAVHPPPRPNDEAVCRAFDRDDDWAQSIELQIAVYGSDESESHRAFVTARATSNRSLVAGGHGTWFGAFVGDTLVAQLGLLSVSPDVARFQTVETHPDHRQRGLAGTLAHHASRYGFDELGARTLVLVADPDYVAIRIYRTLGFTDSETQLQAERGPTAASPD